MFKSFLYFLHFEAHIFFLFVDLMFSFSYFVIRVIPLLSVFNLLSFLYRVFNFV